MVEVKTKRTDNIRKDIFQAVRVIFTLFLMSFVYFTSLLWSGQPLPQFVYASCNFDAEGPLCLASGVYSFMLEVGVFYILLFFLHRTLKKLKVSRPMLIILLGFCMSFFLLTLDVLYPFYAYVDSLNDYTISTFVGVMSHLFIPYTLSYLLVVLTIKLKPGVMSFIKTKPVLKYVFITKVHFLTGLVWGIVFWLIRYCLSVAFLIIVPTPLIPWIIMPIILVLNRRILGKRIKIRQRNYALFLAIVWTSSLILLDYFFYFPVFMPIAEYSGNYGFGLIPYYILTFAFPFIVVLPRKRGTN